MGTSCGPTPLGKADEAMRKASKGTKQARREAAVRAAVCRGVATRAGYRHVGPLVDKLAQLTALGPLPYCSQAYLARELGVCERTVRYWLAALERLQCVEVRRSKPYSLDGGTSWTRRTNRYRLTDIRARARQGLALPLPYSTSRAVRFQHQGQCGNALPVSPHGGSIERAPSGPRRPRELYRRTPGNHERSAAQPPAVVVAPAQPAGPPAPLDHARRELAAMRAVLGAERGRRSLAPSGAPASQGTEPRPAVAASSATIDADQGEWATSITEAFAWAKALCLSPERRRRA